MSKRKKQAKLIRIFRKVHRTMGAYLFFLFIIISISGLLLGWKKNSNGIILPKTETGISTDIKNWLPLDVLQTKAFNALQNSTNHDVDLNLHRIDVRQKKGIVKFIFDNNYKEVQLDGQTCNVLAISKRHSDLLEDIHDGSILDAFFSTEREILKLIYTTVTGLALLTFTLTGFWLWIGPKRMRKKSQRHKSENNKNSNVSNKLNQVDI